jgi:hypothetical protein
MAFKIYSTDDGRVPPVEYLPVGAITPKLGMLLYLSSGVLAIAGGSNSPRYISMLESGAALISGTMIPVIRIQKDMILESIPDAAGDSITVGVCYDLDGGGLKVNTGSTASGNFELVWTEAATTTTTTRIRGRIVA